MDLRSTFCILLIVACLAYTHATCTINGETYNKGEKFTHPEEDADQCKVCVCCEDGKFTCTQRICTVPKCGTKKQVRDADGCCMVCKPQCDNPECPELDCPLSRQAYKPRSCCPSCGCELSSEFPIPVVPVGGFGPCDQCTCYENGTYFCSSLEKPPPSLQCVNPQARKVGQNCRFSCPNDYTCRRSNVLLKRGEFTKIGFNYCTCHPTLWYPRGFCVYPRFMEADKDLQALKKKCVGIPTVSDLNSVDITHMDFLHYFQSI